MKGGHEPYHLLLIEDDEDIQRSLHRFFEIHNFEVRSVSTGRDARKLLNAYPPDIVVCDWKLPDLTGDQLLADVMATNPNTVFILMTGYADVGIAVESLKGGAFYYVTKPFSFDKMLEIIQNGIVEKLFYRDMLRDHDLVEELPRGQALIGKSPHIQKIKNLIHLVKNYNTTVLITGETGTGKELVARAIHHWGKRNIHPILSINCGAIPDDLLEDELFGHVKGAYTGASFGRKGYFEQADKGSLFLDEIGNMGPGIQQKLLRVLQEHTITPLGTTRSVEVDVRIIAATNADLIRLVQEGKFREDLYYRLNVFPINVPPLRERQEDIPFLAQYFVAELARREGVPMKRISNECLERLCIYSWPGNIRELRNSVEYALIVSGSEKIIEISHFNLPGMTPSADSIPVRVEGAVAQVAAREAVPIPDLPDFSEGVDFTAVVQDLEKQLLLEGLNRSGWNKQKAAKLLNMKRTTLVEKLKRLNLDSGKDS